MLDVLVTCNPRPKRPWLSVFPQVRGFYLAKYLRRSGLKAEFLPLSCPGRECRVLVFSEYESHFDRFRQEMEPLLSQVRAERMFCMAAIAASPGHYSTEVREWFGRRGGGALCHLLARPMGPNEQYIGVGVDREVMPPPTSNKDTVVFDFRASKTTISWDRFDPKTVDEVRRALPAIRLIASGPPSFPYKEAFDGWWEYGKSHPEYVRVFERGFAFIPWGKESMGMSVAEAQVSGASIISADQEVFPEMLVSHVPYLRGNDADLIQAIALARQTDPVSTSNDALVRFDYQRVVQRTRDTIGL